MRSSDLVKGRLIIVSYIYTFTYVFLFSLDNITISIKHIHAFDLFPEFVVGAAYFDLLMSSPDTRWSNTNMKPPSNLIWIGNKVPSISEQLRRHNPFRFSRDALRAIRILQTTTPAFPTNLHACLLRSSTPWAPCIYNRCRLTDPGGGLAPMCGSFLKFKIFARETFPCLSNKC